MQSECVQIVNSSYVIVFRALGNYALKTFLQGFAARDDYANAYHTFTVESVKVLQIPVEERVFVVPFNLQCYRAFLILPHVIDLM